METEYNHINYGIYISHTHAYIISLDGYRSKEVSEDDSEKGEGYDIGDGPGNRERHVQNRENGIMDKFCKEIIEQLKKAKRVLIFGPAEAKYELQKEIKATKHLKDVSEEILVTDKMELKEAERFVKNHFAAFHHAS